MSRLSEWPIITYLTPASLSIAGEISPVYAPLSSKYTFSCTKGNVCSFKSFTNRYYIYGRHTENNVFFICVYLIFKHFSKFHCLLPEFYSFSSFRLLFSFSWVNQTFLILLIVYSRNTGKFLAFKKFKRSTAACRNMAHFVAETKLIYSRRRISAADNCCCVKSASALATAIVPFAKLSFQIHP